MADNKPSGNFQSDSYDDPFSDRHPHFDIPSPYNGSTASLSIGQETLHDYEADETLEKQPLNPGQSFPRGLYPPA